MDLKYILIKTDNDKEDFMSIKRGKLEFHNVVGMKTRCKYGEWEEEAQKFKTFIVKNDLFITGPVILQWENEDKESLEVELTIYLPLYNKVSFKDNETFFNVESLSFSDGLKIRHLDMDNNIRVTETILEHTAEKLEASLKKPYYYIYLPVYNEYIIDIYAPIIEGESSI